MGSVGNTENIGNNKTRLNNIEKIRSNSETRRIAQEAANQKKLGTRSWNPESGQRITNVSHQRAENELFNAPVGTVITMDNHNTGDYIGEYTRTANGWTGSQQYKSSYKTPSTVKTASGFAMAVVGNDIRVIKVGNRKK